MRGTIRSRFAPSPTGDLHIGGAWTALAAWLIARQRDGVFILRVEDLDPPRTVPGSAERIMEDLKWLGLDWDEGPGVGGPHASYVQSQRFPIYEASVAKLQAAQSVYSCDCSRTDIARIPNAPHDGDELVYPGTCRTRNIDSPFRRPPSIRLRVPNELTKLTDGVMGLFAQNLERDVGDFVVQRSDGVFAYQLAVVVDDIAMGITDVVRGADLLGSTPRQIFLARDRLGAAPPNYWHVPLVVGPSGERLAKRSRGAVVRELRARGISREEILGQLGCGLGLLAEPSPCDAMELIHLANGGFVTRREPWRIPQHWAL